MSYLQTDGPASRTRRASAADGKKRRREDIRDDSTTLRSSRRRTGPQASREGRPSKAYAWLQVLKWSNRKHVKARKFPDMNPPARTIYSKEDCIPSSTRMWVGRYKGPGPGRTLLWFLTFLYSMMSSAVAALLHD